MQPWAIVVLALLVAYELYNLYGLYSKRSSIIWYIPLVAWTAIGVGIIYALGGFN